jgi:hypothetical protein
MKYIVSTLFFQVFARVKDTGICSLVLATCTFGQQIAKVFDQHHWVLTFGKYSD